MLTIPLTGVQASQLADLIARCDHNQAEQRSLNDREPGDPRDAFVEDLWEDLHEETQAIATGFVEILRPYLTIHPFVA